MVVASINRWRYPRRKRRVNKSSLCNPRHISLSSLIQTSWCLLTCSSSLLSLSSVNQPTKQLAFLRRLPRTKISQKKRRWLIFLPRVAVNQATSSIVATIIVTTVEATNAIVMTDNLTIVIKTINNMIVLVAAIKTSKTASPTRKRTIASAITSRKRATRLCTMTSPLC
jgi:hypothetical protein